ncbi:MAG TPA: hypothetical protein PKM27_03810 [Saprospiraceae bacterium]|nr:hypothetical protein [Saprospiraceae bacterium]HNT19441.1 hypothetical protein [Saprospiraceae bacterium]
MIIDAFLMSSETDLLDLRLNYYKDYFDFFLILESSFTFSGQTRNLVFPNVKHKYLKFEDKIIYVPINEFPKFSDSWGIEFYVRDQIRKISINKFSDEDLIVISDVDEIINIEKINLKATKVPTLIKLDTYYHFLNIKASEVINVNLITPLKFIKSIDIGNRYTYYQFVVQQIENNGWHLTYMFEGNIDAYQKKIEAFSHQELNLAKYKNKENINNCLKYALDIYNRKWVKYKFVNISNEFSANFLKVIRDLGLLNKWTTKNLNLLNPRYWLNLTSLVMYYRNQFWFYRNSFVKKSKIYPFYRFVKQLINF